jgi:arginyl-tRNA synthetase
LLAVGWERFGSEELLQANATAHLFDIYVKISALFNPEEVAYREASKAGKDTNELESSGILGKAKAYFKRMEDGDEEALEVWRRFRSLSIERYKQSYARLNIAFDDYSGESQVHSSTMTNIELILSDKGISEIDEGATVIDFKKHGATKLGTAIIRNRNGTTNYLLRDLGAAIERFEKYKFDQMVYVVMSEQDSHFLRLFKILELMGGHFKEVSGKCRHVNFGKVQGMSTRKGNVKFLDDILQECGTSMHEVMQRNSEKYVQVESPERVADTLGISAVMVQDMRGKRVNNYPFDISRMTSFEGDTGPYLQYAHARLRSVSRKAGYTNEDITNADLSLLKECHAINLIRLLARYPDTVGQALKTLEPTTILTFLFKLTHQLSSGYDVLRVVGASEGPSTSLARASLYEAARQVLSNGMKLLGLSPVDRYDTDFLVESPC